MSTGTWFSRFFEFEEDGPHDANKFDRVQAHLHVTSSRDGSCVMTVNASGKSFWVGRCVQMACLTAACEMLCPDSACVSGTPRTL